MPVFAKICVEHKKNKQNLLMASEVLFVPKLAKNLLSVRAMTKHGAKVCFAGDKCIASKNGQSVVIGYSYNGSLY